MRVLLSVGCNRYEHAAHLKGAEADAKNIFDALVGPDIHQYSPAQSKLVLSPTTTEFRQSLGNLLYENGNIAVVTLYFAGHAVVTDETLYLAFSDTNPAQVAITAIAFTELLRAILSSRPKQANFVLDACNTGGLAFDLAAILKRSIVGASDTTGISFVAAAAAEESANETAFGGAFTIQFEKIIRGSTYIQRATPFVNLMEIAQQIQTYGHLHNQTVSAWALNLQGPNLFAKNPFYSGPSTVADSFVARLQRNSLATANEINALKAALADLTTRFDEVEFSDALERALAQTDQLERGEILCGLIEGLRPDLAAADDAFLESRVYAVFLGKLIGLCEISVSDELAKKIVLWFVEAIRRALTMLVESSRTSRYALIEEPISDLYHLPIRISDIFGQTGLFLLAQEKVSEADLSLASDVISHILKVYGNAVVALTDDQACGFLIFLEACRRRGWTAWGEEVVGRLYNDLHENFGNVAGNRLNAENQVKVLDQRYERIENPDAEIYDSPSDLVTVIFVYLALFKLDEAIDFSLIDLDHILVNFFIPDDATKFGLSERLAGTNISLSLGHDFWRCIDLRRILEADIFPKFSAISAELPPAIQVSILASSLALRDRLPWILSGSNN